MQNNRSTQKYKNVCYFATDKMILGNIYFEIIYFKAINMKSDRALILMKLDRYTPRDCINLNVRRSVWTVFAQFPCSGCVPAPKWPGPP